MWCDVERRCEVERKEEVPSGAESARLEKTVFIRKPGAWCGELSEVERRRSVAGSGEKSGA